MAALIKKASEILARSLGGGGGGGGGNTTFCLPRRTITNWPENYPNVSVIMPVRIEDRGLPAVSHTPHYPPNVVGPLKYPKADREMRGLERIHNQLIYRQYGLMAIGGGALEGRHFDVIRERINKFMNRQRFFAIWRVDPPWKAVSKKGQGKRGGGGKTKVHHFETPVKAGRVLIEVAGIGQYEEIERHLITISNKLPIYAIPISQTKLDALEQEKRDIDERNYNPFKYKDLVLRNFSDSYRLLSKQDL